MFQICQASVGPDSENRETCRCAQATFPGCSAAERRPDPSLFSTLNPRPPTPAMTTQLPTSVPFLASCLLLLPSITLWTKPSVSPVSPRAHSPLPGLCCNLVLAQLTCFPPRPSSVEAGHPQAWLLFPDHPIFAAASVGFCSLPALVAECLVS